MHKTVLLNAKEIFFTKKILHGLPEKLLPVEIVFVAREAIMNLFMNAVFAD